MRTSETFVLGAIMGAVVVWIWGKEIESYVGEKTRGVRAKAAEGLRAVEERTGTVLDHGGDACVAPRNSCRTRRNTSAGLSEQGRTRFARHHQREGHDPGVKKGDETGPTDGPHSGISPNEDLLARDRSWGAGRCTVADIRERLEQDLKTAVSRLRHLAGAAAIEELSWTIRDSGPFADEVDGIQANESREVGLATRELLMERVNRLSAALDRMSEGAYGTCVECGEAISAARLHAMPEVQTCVRCQDGIERRGRQSDLRRRSVFAVGEDDTMSAASLASVRAASAVTPCPTPCR